MKELAGLKAQPPHYRFQTSAYDQCQVIYVSSGQLHFNEHSPVGPGGLVLLREGSAFTLHTRQAGYGGVFCVVAGEEVAAFAGSAVTVASDTDTRQLARMIEREARSPGAGSNDVLRSLGRVLLWRAIRLAGEPAARAQAVDSAAYWTSRARQAIEATLFAGLTVREAVASLPISYRQLCRHFLGSSGTSPKRFQMQARIEESQRLLRDTQMPVTQIAAELGYPSSQHFATQFRAAVGWSPTQWRRRAARDPS